ncbi:MAG TPA: hypothetical protein VIH90_01930 [Candidatus Saccharimonadales bacterium]
MKFTYQTATATLIQFVTLTILGVPNAIVSIVSVCRTDATNCVSNSLVSLVFFLLTAMWFGFIFFLGYSAEHRRSRWFAFILIGCEFITLLADGYINFPRDSNILSKGTSLLDSLLSIWIIYLAFRLFIAGNKRIVKKPITARVRNRKRD